jgi:hypothetical protein
MDLKFNLKTLSIIIIGICILIFFCLNLGNSVPLIKNITAPQNTIPVSMNSTAHQNAAPGSMNRSITFSTAVQKIVNVNVSRAIDVVTNFSRSPDLVVSDFQMIDEKTGCKDTMRVYHITTNEGVYRINSKNDQLITVNYNLSSESPLKNPLERSQLVEISQTFIQEEFGNSLNLTIDDSDFSQPSPAYYELLFPVSNSTADLFIDNKTGYVMEFANVNALPAICFCLSADFCYNPVQSNSDLNPGEYFTLYPPYRRMVL